MCRARMAFAIIFARGTEIAALQSSYYVLQVWKRHPKCKLVLVFQAYNTRLSYFTEVSIYE